MTGAEKEVTHQQAKELQDCQPPREAGGGGGGGQGRVLLEPSDRVWPCGHLVQLLTSKTVGEEVSVTLTTKLCV